MKSNKLCQLLLSLAIVSLFLAALMGIAAAAQHLPFWVVIPLGLAAAVLFIVDDFRNTTR